MIIVIQRVLEASVEVEGQTIGEIGKGLLLFVGIAKGDSTTQVDSLAQQIAQLRVFEDTTGKMGLGLVEAQGEVLVVSQFTLMADFAKGHRPSFHLAAKPDLARTVYNAFVEALRQSTPCKVATGEFGADMKVHLLNDGPVTFVLEG